MTVTQFQAEIISLGATITALVYITKRIRSVIKRLEFWVDLPESHRGLIVNAVTTATEIGSLMTATAANTKAIQEMTVQLEFLIQVEKIRNEKET